MFQVSDQHGSASAKSDLSSIKMVGSEESLGHTIYKLSSEVISLSLPLSPSPIHMYIKITNVNFNCRYFATALWVGIQMQRQ